MIWENRIQTINFLAYGAFNETHPAISSVVHILQEKCPSLFSNITAFGLSIDKRDGDTEDLFMMKGDKLHSKVAIQSRIPQKQIKVGNDVLLSVTHPHRLPHQHEFSTNLLKAYRKAYGFHGLVSIRNKGIQWARRLQFTG